MKDEGAVQQSPPLSRANGSAPKLADGIELIGEYKGSGFKEAPYLARRADGQVLQLPKLLYLVAQNTDGQRDYSAIAEAVSEGYGKGVSADNVRTLADSKLRPLGVLAAPDGSSPKLKRPNPLLALNFRTSVIPAGLVNAITTVFRPFFWPIVLLAGIAGFVALDVWLFFFHGVAQGLRNLLNEPVFFLLVFVLVVLSAALHECGHATGCRYGGAKPGVMGVGLYLVWPAFYTDVTDAYRLGKGGRLRADLGGVYFNALFMLAAVAVYMATHLEILLVVVLFLQFEMIHQFLPFLRLDGYYVIADLTGVPDIFSRIKPVLKSLVPFNKPDRRVTELKPWVRVVVTLWVIFAAVFILYAYGMMVLHLPTILGTAWHSFIGLAGNTASAFQHGRLGLAAFDSLQLLLLALPTLGLGLTLVRLGQRLIQAAWTRTKGRPIARSLSFAGVAALALLLGWAWIPPRATYQPIQPGQNGTVGESFSNASVVVAPLMAPLGVKTPAASPSASAAPSASASASPSATDASPAASASAAASASSTPLASPAPSTSP
jgi:putative peptide zinc metalloprotease protein